MKYKCKYCGQIYDDRPNFCECGNDKFYKMRLKSGRKENNSNENDERSQKENPIFLIIFLILVGFIVYFVLTKLHTIQRQAALDDEYLTKVRKQMLQEFDPQEITNSGYCIISFEINEEGGIAKRKFVQKSPIVEINDSVFEMLRRTTIVEKPPARYRNTPIQIEFGCIADEREVECYSKNNVIHKEAIPEEY